MAVFCGIDTGAGGHSSEQIRNRVSNLCTSMLSGSSERVGAYMCEP